MLQMTMLTTIVMTLLQWGLNTPTLSFLLMVVKPFRIISTCKFIGLTGWPTATGVMCLMFRIERFKFRHFLVSCGPLHSSSNLWRSGILLLRANLIIVVCDVIEHKLLPVHYGLRVFRIHWLPISDTLMIGVWMQLSKSSSFRTIMSMMHCVETWPLTCEPVNRMLVMRMNVRWLWCLIVHVRIVFYVVNCATWGMRSLQPFLFGSLVVNTSLPCFTSFIF